MDLDILNSTGKPFNRVLAELDRWEHEIPKMPWDTQEHKNQKLLHFKEIARRYKDTRSEEEKRSLKEVNREITALKLYLGTDWLARLGHTIAQFFKGLVHEWDKDFEKQHIPIKRELINHIDTEVLNEQMRNLNWKVDLAQLRLKAEQTNDPRLFAQLRPYERVVNDLNALTVTESSAGQDARFWLQYKYFINTPLENLINKQDLIDPFRPDGSINQKAGAVLEKQQAKQEVLSAQTASGQQRTPVHNGKTDSPEHEGNINALQAQAKELGIGKINEAALTEKIKSGIASFAIAQQERVRSDNVLVNLHINKDAKGTYTLDGYAVTVYDKAQKEFITHHFTVSGQHKHNPRLQEAVNMLKGRFVYKEWLDKAGQSYTAWKGLDLSAVPRDGQFPEKNYRDGYGFHPERLLPTLNIKEAQDPAKLGPVIKALKRGDEQRVTDIATGQRYRVSANPRERKLNILDQVGAAIQKDRRQNIEKAKQPTTKNVKVIPLKKEEPDVQPHRRRVR